MLFDTRATSSTETTDTTSNVILKAFSSGNKEAPALEYSTFQEDPFELHFVFTKQVSLLKLQIARMIPAMIISVVVDRTSIPD